MTQNDRIWEQLDEVSSPEALSPELKPSPEPRVISLDDLRREIDDLRQANTDLEILLETTTEHSTHIETELQAKNETMEDYLRHVYCVTAAAAAVEEGTFQPSMLAGVTLRDDQLGQLARMFQSMIAQVKYREETLKRQVEELKIEIDQTRRVQQVSQITQTEYFKELKQKAKQIRGSLSS